jgi:hypothetical protein
MQVERVLPIWAFQKRSSYYSGAAVSCPKTTFDAPTRHSYSSGLNAVLDYYYATAMHVFELRD